VQLQRSQIRFCRESAHNSIARFPAATFVRLSLTGETPPRPANDEGRRGASCAIALRRRAGAHSDKCCPCAPDRTRCGMHPARLVTGPEDDGEKRPVCISKPYAGYDGGLGTIVEHAGLRSHRRRDGEEHCTPDHCPKETHGCCGCVCAGLLQSNQIRVSA
jgi:hypothetical protein